MRVPTPPQPPSRWETIRYALDSNARTIRLCFILLIGSSAVVLTVIGLLGSIGCPTRAPRSGVAPPVRERAVRERLVVANPSANLTFLILD